LWPTPLVLAGPFPGGQRHRLHTALDRGDFLRRTGLEGANDRADPLEIIAVTDRVFGKPDRVPPRDADRLEQVGARDDRGEDGGQDEAQGRTSRPARAERP
jgi:hypothetical protein